MFLTVTHLISFGVQFVCFIALAWLSISLVFIVEVREATNKFAAFTYERTLLMKSNDLHFLFFNKIPLKRNALFKSWIYNAFKPMKKYSLDFSSKWLSTPAFISLSSDFFGPVTSFLNLKKGNSHWDPDLDYKMGGKFLQIP